MNIETYISLVFPNGLSLSDAIEHILNVGIYIVGIALYAAFIFHFYRFLSSRDMFKFDLSGHEESPHRALRGLVHVAMYVVKYVVVFPVFAFFWFAVLTLILTLLSKDRAFSQVLLVALATVSAIRVAAYYHEDLARDLSKILPFAVLGIFIIDASYFNPQDSLAVLRDANNHRELIFYYFAFLVILEFALRVVMGYVKGAIAFRSRPITQGEQDPSEQAGTAAASLHGGSGYGGSGYGGPEGRGSDPVRAAAPAD